LTIVHELAISEANVSEVCAHVGDVAAGARIVRVTVEIGRLAAVVVDAIQFCFEIAAKDTAVEGAELEVIDKPALGKCRSCRAPVDLGDSAIGTCVSCGSIDVEIVGGQELRIRSVEVV
jgi:hydrogenase nickel incorporation protein HypA/HybF